MTKEKIVTELMENCFGIRHAVGGKALAKRLNISENELRRRINRLRRDGVPIASGSAGYYYAENAGQVYETICSLKKMAAGLNAAINGLERALAIFGGEH